MAAIDDTWDVYYYCKEHGPIWERRAVYINTIVDVLGSAGTYDEDQEWNIRLYAAHRWESMRVHH